ncbi:hypothetical protein [Nonomuraea jiangxiensis]|uniref:Uncharacterized protein n=1 Tax=Nonomuraea jiangxiensis TaxID=633440 RepID=A0A1G8W720_9ACTN|nr:hypothetical protein [Nonomuraea jiangxiensis]SDJ74082.1 hypothetical protein SAMN05421869_11269 [Nonomuraea jiangxiensis]
MRPEPENPIGPGGGGGYGLHGVEGAARDRRRVLIVPALAAGQAYWGGLERRVVEAFGGFGAEELAIVGDRMSAVAEAHCEAP